jgi:rare lipoprotein A
MRTWTVEGSLWLLGFTTCLCSACAGSTPQPCHCTCAPAYGQQVLPDAQTDTGRAPVAVVDAGGTPDAAAYGTGHNSSIVLSEQQLLARYEGKTATKVLSGKATYYANSLAGRKTASGETYDPKAFTAAHRTLPFGTVVRVVRTDTNRYVYVSITDRGPFAGGNRIIDLSYVAAERLGMVRAGVVPVRVEVLR